MLNSVSNIRKLDTVRFKGVVNEYAGNISSPYIDDSFEYINNKNINEDKSNNGKFDFSQAAKNFGKGLVSPITMMFKHPLATIGIVAATAAATSLVPVLGPLLAIGFGAASIYQAGKGVYEAAKNYKNGEYDNAEKSFDKIGQGVIGAALSLLGVKQSAKIANEAKLMKELNVKSLTHAQRTEIAQNIDKGGFFKALKDTMSLVTSKKGIKASFEQFKPASIKTRYNEFIECFNGNRNIIEEKDVTRKRKVKKMTPEEFKKTPEGIRRAALSDEEIKQEVTALYDEAFDKLGIPKEQRPNLNLEKGAETNGGSYAKSQHTLNINTEGYKAGTFELEDIVMHEATHCKEALLRAGIPQERANQIVKEELLSRIVNGESEQIVVKGNFMGPDMMEPPKMSPKMKQDFAQFASDNLYTENSIPGLSDYIDNCRRLKFKYSVDNFAESKQKVQPFLDKLQKLLDKNPEFVSQYSSSEEALNTLAEYSCSHNVRYNFFRDVKINKGTKYSPDYINLSELSGEQLAQAEKSLINNITTIEGNGRISGIGGMFASGKAFNQYQFSPEEVLAQKNGNNFLIEKLTAKLNEMKINGNINAQEEARLTEAIRKAKAVIEYKTKGFDYYEKYTQMINNPQDAKLTETVKILEAELTELKSKITPEEYKTITEVIKVLKPDIATTMIPTAAIYSLLAKLDGNKAAA